MKKKIKEKLNPLMTDAKEVKKIRKSNINNTEDENEIKKFLIILVVLVVIIAILYGITEFLNKSDESDNATVVAGSINYDKVTVGTILNRPYDVYYVMIYDGDTPDAVLYSAILSAYMNNNEEDDYIKIYYCDLGNNLNNSYYNVGDDNKSNPKAQSVSEFDFGGLTLLKIKKGKVVKYIEDLEEIRELLGV